MSSQPRMISFELPRWIDEACAGYAATASVEKRMEFVIGASRRNVEEGTGGPFGAAVFETATGGLVSLGVNLVVPQGLSMLHAEMVAIALAQRKLGTYDLGGGTSGGYQLFTTTEPCAMCLGAVVWSGVGRLVTGARDEDARRIGFDEGPKVGDWARALGARGIDVVTETLRPAAREVLDLYGRSDGRIYSPVRREAR